MIRNCIDRKTYVRKWLTSFSPPEGVHISSPENEHLSENSIDAFLEDESRRRVESNDVIGNIAEESADEREENIDDVVEEGVGNESQNSTTSISSFGSASAIKWTKNLQRLTVVICRLRQLTHARELRDIRVNELLGIRSVIIDCMGTLKSLIGKELEADILEESPASVRGGNDGISCPAVLQKAINKLMEATTSLEISLNINLWNAFSEDDRMVVEQCMERRVETLRKAKNVIDSVVSRNEMENEV